MKLKIRELLNLEPGKHYVMKCILSQVSDESMVEITNHFLKYNIFIHPIGVHNLTDIQFEEK